MAKIVGNNIYIHKSAFDDLLERIKDSGRRADVIVAKQEIDDAIAKNEKENEVIYKSLTNYEVIKYDKSKHQISFIDSPDWLTANEPEVGDAIMLKMNQDWSWKFIPARKKNKQIYHSKELFIEPSFYDGFDVIAAHNRTKQWQAIPGIKEVKKYIGNKDFWVKFLNENGMEI